MSALDDFMKTFPEDIQELAWAEVNGSHGYLDSTGGAVAIARAILAERERCADVARRYLEDIAGCNMNEDESEKIAAAIMDPKWEPPSI